VTLTSTRTNCFADMLSVHASAMGFSSNMMPSAASARAINMGETAASLEELANTCNPKVGLWDPCGIIERATENKMETETLGWFRHAEIKHGRVAMAAFVGFCVQSNGIYFPWDLANGVSHASIAAAGGPGDQWDALPTPAKVQILTFIGLLELYSETTFVLEKSGEKHYVLGGKPGYFPPFAYLRETVGQPPLDLWDPFGFTKKLTEEQKARKLAIEINNGRLAMIGIFGMLSASKGLYVPGLDSIAGIKPYAGEYMAPFSMTNADLPFVTDMLGWASTNLKIGNLVEGINNYM